MRSRYAVAWVLVGWMATAAVAQEPPVAALDAEMAAHLQALGKKLEDPTLGLAVRGQTALEIAAALDRAAQAATSADVRRARWSEAVAVLDRFAEANPGHPLAGAFQVQAGVYLWAQARTWVHPARANLAAATARERAAADLNASAERLRPAVAALGDADDLLAQNARFRLAQTLADLSEVGPGDAAARRALDREALTAVTTPPSEPSLVGFVLLIRASLLVRMGRFDDAQTQLTAAFASNPAPPEADLLDVQAAVLDGKGQFDAARKAIEASRLPERSRLALRVRVGLDERVARPAGPQREAAETALFRDLKTLRTAGGSEARVGLLAAAAAVGEPGPSQDPEAWDLLADGALVRGDSERAGSLEVRGADRAAALGKVRLASEMRLKAGAALFQAGQFASADPLLSRVAQDPQAGDLRPRAGLLRALNLGRALATSTPGASSAAYGEALRYQTRTFPADPTAGEARWLLGKLRLAESDRAEALALWSGIPHGAPQWLDSRREIARLRQEDLDTRRIGGDADAIARQLADTRRFLDECQNQARGDEPSELLLARARLELTPGVGRPDEARDAAERVLRSATRPAQRDMARGFQIIALAQSSRFVEAEQAARREVAATAEHVPAVLLSTLRLLDRAAAEAESDLKTRRMGMLMAILLQPLADQGKTFTPTERAEIHLREIRARLFSSNDVAARQSIRGWGPSSLATSPDLLRDLAETYAHLDAFELAADVQRLRARQLTTGSLPWFDARYGLALALYRSGKAKDALALIDATAILHPDLGGGELHLKYIRLRQRIAPGE
jgi:tetratricopeptide (TPR) repeat protein